MMTKNQQKVIKLNRLAELYETACARYLDKTDFDYSEWLDSVELKEYKKLEKEMGLG